ncbi:hypothetical protein [Aquibium oceanicum]|uniref:hypothetical protein n=1 Tax=Aquibium oceanicum TaxID=1670800 RepID=UPI0012FF7B2E|nr:hypothetical protein [Aquibium oceanicum]
MLIPYWIEFENASGVGITARSEDDALALLARVFGNERQPLQISPIDDLSHLDQEHVVPNMGNWLRRGIWYPLGFDSVPEF